MTFSSLPNAVKAAIEHGNALTDIRPEYWALTYRCSTEAVKDEWERQTWERTTKPQNSFQMEGK